MSTRDASSTTQSAEQGLLSLAGRRVVVTRSRHQSAEMCRQLEACGAEAVVMPTIAIAPPADPARVRATISQLETYDRLILTSANAVRALSDALSEAGVDASVLTGVAVCAIGPGTARALAALGVRPDLVARDYLAEGLLEQLPAGVVGRERVLLFRAQTAREVLPETLRERGAAVDVVAAYVTTLPAAELWAAGLAAMRAGRVDAVTLTSASTARNLTEIVGDDAAQVLSKVVVAAIGPISASACAELGLRVDVVPERHTVAALVDALARHFELRRARPDEARPDEARPDEARPDEARPDEARPDEG